MPTINELREKYGLSPLGNDGIEVFQNQKPGGLDNTRNMIKYSEEYNSVPSTLNRIEKKKGILERIGDFTGVTNLAKGVGYAVADWTGAMDEITKNQESAQKSNAKLMDIYKKRVESGKMSKEEYGQKLQDISKSNQEISGWTEEYMAERPTEKQIISSAGQTALILGTAGALGVKAGAKVVGKEVVKRGVLGTALKTGAKVAPITAGYGALEKYGEEGTGQEIVSSAIKSGLAGFALGTVGSLAGQAISGIAKKIKGAPETIYKAQFPETLKERSKNIKFGEKALGTKAMEKGVSGSSENMYDDVLLRLDKSEDELQKIIAPVKEKIFKKELVSSFDDIIKTKVNTPGMASEAKKITKIFTELPEEITLSQANQIKRNLYKAIGDKAYQFDATIPSTVKESQKALAKSLKELIEKKSGSSEIVKNLNKDLSSYGKMRDVLLKKLAKEEVSQGIKIVPEWLDLSKPWKMITTPLEKALNSTTVANAANRFGQKITESNFSQFLKFLMNGTQAEREAAKALTKAGVLKAIGEIT